MHACLSRCAGLSGMCRGVQNVSPAPLSSIGDPGESQSPWESRSSREPLQVNGEGIQILHYTDGQKYEPHHDFFHDKFNSRPENGGQRIATVLMYL